jgi:hypothetical protein
MIEEGKNSRSRYTRSRSFLNDIFDPDEIREISEKRIAGEQIVHLERDIIRKFVYHIDSKNCVFYVDVLKNLISNDKEMKEIFMKKLTGKSYV